MEQRVKCNQHIEAETKWTEPCKQHFQTYFFLMQMFEFRLKFHWILLIRIQLTIFQHWFKKRLGTVQVTSHYQNQWWLFYWCIYASFSLNELRKPYSWEYSAKLQPTEYSNYRMEHHQFFLFCKHNSSLLMINNKPNHSCWAVIHHEGTVFSFDIIQEGILLVLEHLL